MKTLSKAHQNAFNSMAHLIERGLMDVEATLLKYGNHRAVYFDLNDDLSVEENELLKQEMRLLYGLLKEFGSAYNVDKHHSSLRKEINIKFRFMWEQLAGKRLEGYGRIDDTEKKNFEQLLERIVSVINTLIADTHW